MSLHENKVKLIFPRARDKESRFPRASKTLTGFIHAHIRPGKRGDLGDRQLAIIKISCISKKTGYTKTLEMSLYSKGGKGDPKYERDRFRQNTRVLFASSPFYPFGLDCFSLDPLRVEYLICMGLCRQHIFPAACRSWLPPVLPICCIASDELQ